MYVWVSKITICIHCFYDFQVEERKKNSGRHSTMSALICTVPIDVKIKDSSQEDGELI